MASKPLRFLSMQACPDKNDSAALYTEDQFHQLLRIEVKRAQRSGRPFLLLLLNCSSSLERRDRKLEALKRIRRALYCCSRETDMKGWFKEDAIIGVIFTEISRIDDTVRDQILGKAKLTLNQLLGPEEAEKVKMSLLAVPEDRMSCQTEE